MKPRSKKSCSEKEYTCFANGVFLSTKESKFLFSFPSAFDTKRVQQIWYSPKHHIFWVIIITSGKEEDIIPSILISPETVYNTYRSLIENKKTITLAVSEEEMKFYTKDVYSLNPDSKHNY